MQECGKNLFLLGISSGQSPSELVGACGLSPQECTDFEKDLLERDDCAISEVAVLSTCNRVEFYFSANDKSIAEEIFKALKKLSKPADDFKEHAYFKSNADALEHLFEVASGLKSQMVGETEILGQVKAAYARSSIAGHCKSVLNPAFQKASQCAKWIRTNTDIGHGKISIGSVAAELATRIFEDISNAEILLIGSGEAGKLVAEALSLRGAKNITVSSRTLENAEILAQKIDAKTSGISDSIANLSRFDIVVCASRSTELIINKTHVENAISTRLESPVFLMDLAVPLNIDPMCADIENAFLYNLEDLSKIANENIKSRIGEIESARTHIAQRASATAKRLFGLKAATHGKSQDGFEAFGQA